jgi:hypothetical protein
LEEAIVHYHSPDERRLAEHYVKGWRQGYFGDYWGRAQHFVLPALDSRRVQPSTISLVGVNPRHWKYLRYLGGKNERKRFEKNPYTYMYSEYKSKYHGVCKRYGKQLREELIVLRFMNIEQVGNKLKVNGIDM